MIKLSPVHGTHDIQSIPIITFPLLFLSIQECSFIDPTVLAGWESMTGLGYSEFLSRMVIRFVEDANRCIEEVHRAVEGQDRARLARAAHGLKGISGNMGGRPLAKLSYELQQRGRNQVRDKNEELCHQLQSEFQQAQEAFTREVEKQHST